MATSSVSRLGVAAADGVPAPPSSGVGGRTQSSAAGASPGAAAGADAASIGRGGAMQR